MVAVDTLMHLFRHGWLTPQNYIRAMCLTEQTPTQAMKAAWKLYLEMYPLCDRQGEVVHFAHAIRWLAKARRSDEETYRKAVRDMDEEVYPPADEVDQAEYEAGLDQDRIGGQPPTRNWGRM